VAQAWIALGLGAAIALAGLEYSRARWMVDPQALAYGSETQPSFGEVDGRAVHCSGRRDTQLCEAAYAKAGDPPAILWFGNSQLAGINRSKPGDENAPQQLHRLAAARGQYVVAYSQPNANLAEHALAAAALTPIYRPRLVVLPVVFDDIREQGVREDLVNLTEAREAMDGIRQWRIRRLVSRWLQPEAASTGKLETDESIQAAVEKRLNAWLDRFSPFFADRAQLRGTASATLHAFRNQLLSIHSTTKRSVDPALVDSKLAVLTALLADLRDRGVGALVYVPPYRTDIDGPYVAAEYNAFKRHIELLAGEYGAQFANLESLVPGPEWGTVHDRILGTAEPDFMHFTAEGHRRLAIALNDELARAGY
jgi:hypothetical protein